MDVSKTRRMFPHRRDLIVRIERTWALDAAVFAAVLHEQDPSWGSQTFELGGGHAVLCGAGLYVNRALAFGLEQSVTVDDFAELEARADALGVDAAVEITPVTDHSVSEIANDRHYRVDGFKTAHVRSLDDQIIGAPDPSIVVERADDELLEVWSETTATGWGHTTSAARRASDAFSRAAAVVDQRGFVIALDSQGRRPLGCASLTIRDGIATLGGMSTIPSERGRGVQGVLINHRLRFGQDAGCDLATSSTVPGGGSERNLVRAGFRPLYDKLTLVRSAATQSSA